MFDFGEFITILMFQLVFSFIAIGLTLWGVILFAEGFIFFGSLLIIFGLLFAIMFIKGFRKFLKTGRVI